MKLALLYSGGKDSNFALFRAMKHEKVVCLISVVSDNPESYMFHTPNIHITAMQAEALGLPLITAQTKGVKEVELEDLRKAIVLVKNKFGVEGIVTGAIESVYQASRVQRICAEEKLWCFNPLWKMNQEKLLYDLLELNFEIIISGVFAEPFDKSWLGMRIDTDTVKKLIDFAGKYKINPAGEGGEIETTVLDAPFFRKKIKVVSSEIKEPIFLIKRAELVDK